MTGTKKRRGRKPSFVLYNGQAIEGLYVTYNADKSVRNYYYLDKNNKQISCTSDLKEAVRRYSKYQNKVNYVKVFGEPKALDLNNLKEGFSRKTEFEVIIDKGEATIQTIDLYPKHLIVQRFVELLKEDPYGIAKLSGIPELADIENIDPLPKSVTLSEIRDDYNKRTDIERKTVRDELRYFKVFCDVVGRATLREITFDDVRKYADYIHQVAKTSSTVKNKYEWIRANFGGVKNIIKNAMARYEYKTDFKKLKDNFDLLKNVKKRVIKPKIVSVEQFKELYENSLKPKKYFARCILLLGLNSACRYSELSHLKKEDIDFEKSELSFPRHKTGIIQSSVLWTETIEAIKEYIKEKPNNTDYIFITKNGNQYKRDDLEAYFTSIRGNKSSKVTQDLLKKTFETVATNCGIGLNCINIVMGHTIKGLDNNYNQRNAKATAQAVKAVYEVYFK